MNICWEEISEQKTCATSCTFNQKCTLNQVDTLLKCVLSLAVKHGLCCAISAWAHSIISYAIINMNIHSLSLMVNLHTSIQKDTKMRHSQYN